MKKPFHSGIFLNIRFSVQQKEYLFFMSKMSPVGINMSSVHDERKGY